MRAEDNFFPFYFPFVSDCENTDDSVALEFTFYLNVTSATSNISW